MTGSHDAGRGTWPDTDEWNRWHDALAGAAGRLREERGVDETWQLAVDPGVLWAEYGDRRVRLAGQGAELSSPDELFEELDYWVAFDRMAGPGRVLDRDRQVMAEWRQRIPAVRQFWEEVARRVFRDVEASTDLRLAWKVVVHEDGPDWPAMFHGAGGDGRPVGGIITTDVPMPQLGRRLLNFPEVWLETPHTGRSLPEMGDEDEATGYLADLVQEDVIEEVHGAWPRCPRHPHPLDVGYTESGVPVWTCPKTPDIAVTIGALGPQSASST